MYSSDTGGLVRAVSDAPVRTDKWTYIAGRYDATGQTIDVFVCYVDGGIEHRFDSDDYTNQTGIFTPDGGGWLALGDFQVGRSRISGSYAEDRYWAGGIDEVKVYDRSLLDTDSLYRHC
jgi:hypothetical protein